MKKDFGHFSTFERLWCFDRDGEPFVALWRKVFLIREVAAPADYGEDGEGDDGG